MCQTEIVLSGSTGNMQTTAANQGLCANQWVTPGFQYLMPILYLFCYESDVLWVKYNLFSVWVKLGASVCVGASETASEPRP